MLFHVDNVDNFVHNLIFQHFFIFLKVENFLPINSPIHIFFKSLCNLLISTLFDIFPCKISYLQYLTIHTNQFYSLTIPLCIVAWLPFATFTVTSFAMHKNHALHDFAPQFSGFLRTLFKKAPRGMLSANNNVADSRHCTKRPGKPSPAVNVRTG